MLKRILILLLVYSSLTRVDAFTDTGNGQIFIPANKNLGLGIKNTNSKLTINGNIAVKETTRPNQNTNHGKLYVNGTTSNLMFLDDNNNQYDLLTVVGGGGSIGIDTLAGLDSSQFLRSDTSDQFTSGTLTIATGTNLNVDGELAVADSNISLTGASTTFTATGAMTLSPAAGTNLNINTSGAGDLAVNINQFYIDSSTSNIGLGNTSPVSRLDVRGTLTTNGFAMATGAANNYLLKTDAAGNAAWIDPNSITVNNTDTLDGIDSNQFLRSDTSDQFTSGTLTTNTGTILRVNGDSYFNNTIRLAPNNNIVLVKGSTINGAAAEEGFRVRMKPAYINSSRDALMFEKLETNSNFPGGFAFITTDRNGTQANAFTISGSGDFTRIGINEKNPQNIIQATGSLTPSIALAAKDSSESGYREFLLQGIQNNGNLINKWAVGNFSDKSNQGANMFYVHQYSNNGDQFLHPTIPQAGVHRLIINDNGQFAFGYDDYDHVPTIFDFAFNGTGMFDSELAIKEAPRTSFTSNYGRLYTNGTTSNLMFLDDSGNQYDLLLGVGAPANNATTVDGIDSLQFLRSDTSDVFTSGTLTIKNGTTFRVNGNLAIADNNILFNSPTGVTFTPTAGQSLRTNTVSTGDFAVNNNQLYFDTSASRIGIGFNNPNSKLTVNGNIDLREITATTASSNTGELFVQNSNSELYFDADDQNALQLTNNGSLNFTATKINDLSDAVSDDTSSVFLGQNSGSLSPTNTFSTAVGINALQLNSNNGLRNTAVGLDSLRFINNVDNNIAIGTANQRNNINGNGNVAVGNNALEFNTNGEYNTAVGVYCLRYAPQLSPTPGNTGNFNTALGHSALYINNGSYNTVTGKTSYSYNFPKVNYLTMFSTDNYAYKEEDTTIGRSLFRASSISNNGIGLTIGHWAGILNNGDNIISIGAQSTRFSGRSVNSTAMGFLSSSRVTDNMKQVAFGTRAGADAAHITTDRFGNGVFLGYEAGYDHYYSPKKLHNIAIGYRANYQGYLVNNILIGPNTRSMQTNGGNIGNSIYVDNITKDTGIGIVNSRTSKLLANGEIGLRKVSKPSHTSNYGKLYVNGSSSNLMFVDDSGNEYNLLAGVGGSDANTLDFLDSSQFLRSDTSDQFTSGTLTTLAGTNLRVNGDLAIADNNISLSGASTTFTGTGATTFSPNAGSNLNFNLSGAGNFAVNTNQLFLNTSTGNIGAGTNTSNEKLTNEGRLALLESSRPNTSANYGKLYVNGSTSNLMLLDDAGVEFDLLARSAPPSMANQDTIDGIDSSQFLRSDISDTLTSGTLAIGSSSTLRVNGDIEIADSSVVLNGPSTTFYSNGPFALATGSNTNLNITVSGAGDFSVNGNKLFVNGATNNTGINLNNPNEKLSIASTLSLNESSRPGSTSNFGKLYVNGTTSNLMFLDDSDINYDITRRIAPPVNSIDALRDAISNKSRAVYLGFVSGQNNAVNNFSTALGPMSLRYIDNNGVNNTAVGYSSLQYEQNGDNNSALGESSMNNFQGNRSKANVAVGKSTLAGSYSNNNQFNVAIGDNALVGLNGGRLNTSIGQAALGSSRKSKENTAIGKQSLDWLQNGNHNTAAGNFALFSAGAISSRNTAVGYYAAGGINSWPYNTRSFFNNVFLGNESAFNIYNGNNSTYIGYQSGRNIVGDNEILIGSGVESQNHFGHKEINIGNTLFGDSNGSNFAIGIGRVNPNAPFHRFETNGDIAILERARPVTAASYGKLYVNGTTSNLIFLDDAGVQYELLQRAQVLNIDRLVDGKSNSSSSLILGAFSVDANPGSEYITSIGIDSLSSCNSGCSNNTAIGYSSLFSNTTGDFNTAIGVQALQSNTSGSQNTSVGYQSLQTTNTSRNTSISYKFYEDSNNNLLANSTTPFISSARDNVGIGFISLQSLTTGSRNTAIGSWDNSVNQTGNDNISLGAGMGYWRNGQRNISIGTHSTDFMIKNGTDFIVIGHQVPNWYNNRVTSGQVTIGNAIQSNAPGKVAIGGTSGNAQNPAPGVNLHIYPGQMRIDPTANAPSSPGEGDIYVDSDGAKAFCIYLNGSWQKMVGAGACS